jgi:hypothetical protein
MNTKALYRFSGFALMLAGVLFGVGLALHHNDTAPHTVITARWAAVHLGAGFGFLLSLFGWFGLFSRQNERSGFWGLLSFILVVLSTAVMGAATLLLEGLLAPALAAQGVALSAFMVPGQPFFLGFVITLLLFTVGYVLTGIVAFSANTLYRIASILLIIAALMVALGLSFLPTIVFRIGGLILGIAFIRFGSILWSTAEISADRFLSERLATT